LECGAPENVRPDNLAQKATKAEGNLHSIPNRQIPAALLLVPFGDGMNPALRTLQLRNFRNSSNSTAGPFFVGDFALMMCAILR